MKNSNSFYFRIWRLTIYFIFLSVFIFNWNSNMNTFTISALAEELHYDIPESQGVANTLKNFDSLIEVNYQTIAYLPQQTGNFEPGNYSGLPYSSTKIEMGFVPNYVSLHTFITALKDPSSYLYSTDLSVLGNSNGNTYYGSVCSIACLFAFGIDEWYITEFWHNIPGMVLLPDQDAARLKLGDTICTKSKGHVVMVTAIERNSAGEIKYITISEATSPRVRRVRYTLERFQTRYPTSKFNYWRYSNIKDVKLCSDKMEIGETDFDIIPKKGDKSNWLEGNIVELDVLNNDRYDTIEVYKDGTVYGQYAITGTLRLKDLPHGKYKARLTGSGATSAWCQWIVADVRVTVNDNSISFSCSNGTPLFVLWCPNNNTIREVKSLTDTDRRNGSIPSGNVSGSNKVRVAFRTEYGIVFSNIEEKKPVEAVKEEKKEATKEAAIEKNTRQLRKGEIAEKNKILYKVTKKGKEVVVTGWTGSLEKIKIGKRVYLAGYSYSVVGIESNAFSRNNTVKTVTVSSSVKYIGKGAFSNCSALKKVTLYNGLERIGKRAFYGCLSIKNITIPQSVNKIGDMAFMGCKNLRKVIIKTKKLNEKRFGKKVFKGTKKTLQFYVPRGLKNSYQKLIQSKGGNRSSRIKGV